MLRPLLVIACMMACSGCSSAQRSLKPTKDEKEAPAPKDYPYKDLSTGSSAFYRH